ncbi:MAG: nitroreductase family protein [Candidatus Woesearchaeota archaeon]
MDVFEAIQKRRSIRSYIEKPVEFEKIATIIEAGHLAPSAGNIQEWKFIIVTEKEKIKQVANYCLEQYWIASAPVLIVICCDPEKQEVNYGLRGVRLYSIQDSACAAENMLLAATGLGLGSCWVGAFDEERIKEIFNIPKNIRVQSIITIGYSNEVPTRQERQSLESITYFNNYGMRIENINRYLREYSLEWQRIANESKPKWNSFLNGIKKKLHMNSSNYSKIIEQKTKKK